MSNPPSNEVFLNALRSVLDPEVGMNIVDLGLVYRLELVDAQLQVDMTMTSPACPMGESIIAEAEAVLRPLLPAGAELALNLVWEPEWTPARMSESARAHFGWEA